MEYPECTHGESLLPWGVSEDFVDLSPASPVGGGDTAQSTIFPSGLMGVAKHGEGLDSQAVHGDGPWQIKKYELDPKGDGEPLKSF